MNIQSVHDYYQKKRKVYLSIEQAICYVASCLTDGDTYPTELLVRIKDNSRYAVSDTVLFSALNILNTSKLVTDYRKKVEGRGRPRRMFSINDCMQSEIDKLSEYWAQENR